MLAKNRAFFNKFEKILLLLGLCMLLTVIMGYDLYNL